MKYIVKPGDTLGGLALVFDTSVHDLRNLNPWIGGEGLLHKGLALDVPQARAFSRPVICGCRPMAANTRSPMSSDGFRLTAQTYSASRKVNQCTPEWSRLRKAAGTIIAELGIVPRAKWGALRPNHAAMEVDTDYTVVVIHHSGDSGEQDPRKIEKEHMRKHKWQDVGYHYMVRRDGRIYEGTPLGYKGTHVANANTGKIGILYMGDYQHGKTPDRHFDGDDELSKKQMERGRVLILTLKKHVKLSRLGGHRDYLKGTVCPGTRLYAALGGVRRDTGLQGP